MPKTPPDRLAAALRANLKRRKAPAVQPAPASALKDLGKDPANAVEKPETLPPAKA